MKGAFRTAVAWDEISSHGGRVEINLLSDGWATEGVFVFNVCSCLLCSGHVEFAARG